jgi:hypothetical protein
LVAISREPNRPNVRKAYWLFRCDCGTKVVVDANKAASGHTKSCGCLQKETTAKRNATHGMARTRTYRAWRAMKSRCQNPNATKFRFYGGRGIEVCERWERFENFLSDMGQCGPGLSLDRIDPNGNYEPGNCRWATRLTQANNTRSNVNVTLNGDTKTIAEWCALSGLRPFTVYSRINIYGWTPERALTTPPKQTGRWPGSP